MSKRVNAPSPLLLALEPVRAGLEAVSLAISKQDLSDGGGQPVIVYPGLATNRLATSLMRRRLEGAGFVTYDWQQGLNRGPRGDFDQWIAHLAQQVDALQAQHQRRIALVGWSLGGVFAREVAKRTPASVAQVVTLGTPFVAHEDATNAGKLYELLNGQSPDFSRAFLKALRKTPSVPTTSVYSKTDGVVAWQCSVEFETNLSQNIELNSVSHLGMVLNPAVLRVLTRVLAQPHDQWKRYDEVGPLARHRRTRSKQTSVA